MNLGFFHRSDKMCDVPIDKPKFKATMIVNLGVDSIRYSLKLASIALHVAHELVNEIPPIDDKRLKQSMIQYASYLPCPTIQ